MMLVEEFIASIGVSTKSTQSTTIAKDAAVFIYELQPLVAQRSLFKKSTTLAQCLAASTTHIFAAQADKAVVHVYNKAKGTQESTVPFQEKISSIALACNDAILALGTAEGRIILWETSSGRQLTTANSHLQPVTSIVIDHDSNRMLSASADSTIHVWSLAALLSFSNAGVDAPAPLRTFTGHRAEIVALCIGHSRSFCNIAVSAAKDKTCLIWDIHTATLLRTYLLPAIPTCLTIDPADRAVYVGYQDGTLQQLEIFDSSDDSAASSYTAVQNATNSTRPLQPSTTSRWSSSDVSNGAVLSIALSYDGSIVLTGHESGHVLSWEVGRGSFRTVLLQQPLPGPVTNLEFLPIRNSAKLETEQALALPEIVKPKFGAFDASDSVVPGNYLVNAKLCEVADAFHDSSHEAFITSLTLSSFPDEMIDQGLGELKSWTQRSDATSNGFGAMDDDENDYMALDGQPARVDPGKAMEKENETLKQQLQALRNLQTVSFSKIEKLTAERQALLQREQLRLARHGNSITEDESE